jgi:hypothetical protein
LWIVKHGFLRFIEDPRFRGRRGIGLMRGRGKRFASRKTPCNVPYVEGIESVNA